MARNARSKISTSASTSTSPKASKVPSFEYIGIVSMGGTIESDEDAGGNAVPKSTIDYAEFINKYVRPGDSRSLAIRICSLDSRDVTDEHREAAFREMRASPLSKFLLLHGTFTMDKTLMYLQQRKDELQGKKIVAVASFWTSFGRGAMHTDALFNLGGAYYTARYNERDGIWLAMHGSLWTPEEVHKDTEHNLFVRET